jgi:hypothetical protein
MTAPDFTDAVAFARVTGGTGAAVAAKDCTTARSGAGDYDVTLGEACPALGCSIQVTSETAARMVRITHTSDTVKRVRTFNAAGAAADASFTIVVKKILASPAGGY